MKIILAALFLIISITSLTQADDEELSIDCTIGKVNYVYFNQLLSCTAGSKVKIMKRDIKVTSVCGESNTTGVNVFYALSKVVRYIPKNLEVVFPDLFGFRLESTQLKMVTKEDLKPFTGLRMFASVSNHIEFLEEDLFTYNRKLEYVSFRANKITFIDPTVFTAISGTLKQLYMDAQAINCGIGNPTTETAIEKALIKLETSQCIDILNAPPLYTLWLELKAQVSEGSEDLDTCISEKEDAQSALENAKLDLTTCSTDLDECKNDLTAKEAQLGTFEEISSKLGQCCGEDDTRAGCS